MKGGEKSKSGAIPVLFFNFKGFKFFLLFFNLLLFYLLSVARTIYFYISGLIFDG
jgi:hypothetical protein